MEKQQNTKMGHFTLSSTESGHGKGQCTIIKVDINLQSTIVIDVKGKNDKQ